VGVFATACGSSSSTSTTSTPATTAAPRTTVGSTSTTSTRPVAPGTPTTTTAPAGAPPATASAACSSLYAKYGAKLPPGTTQAQAATLLADACSQSDLLAIVEAKAGTSSPQSVQAAVAGAIRLICPTNPGTKLCP